jgi:hypothetical protein
VYVFAFDLAEFEVGTVTSPFAPKQCDAVSASAGLTFDPERFGVDLLDVLGLNLFAPLFTG